jgi:hypothetical protein
MLLSWNDVHIRHLLQKPLDRTARARTQKHDDDDDDDDDTDFPFL